MNDAEYTIEPVDSQHPEVVRRRRRSTAWQRSGYDYAYLIYVSNNTDSGDNEFAGG